MLRVPILVCVLVGRETAGESKEQTRTKSDDYLLSPDGIYAVLPVPNTEE